MKNISHIKIVGFIVVIVAILAGLFIFIIDDSETNGISAMDGLTVSDAEANAWNVSAVLIKVKADEPYENGKASAWWYVYANSPDNEIRTSVISIKVDADMSYQQTTETLTYAYPIENWSIDSSNYLELAKENAQISDYFSQHPDARLENIVLVGENDQTNGCMWSAQWMDPGFIDDPHSARIWIDATTGEVLEVEIS